MSETPAEYLARRIRARQAWADRILTGTGPVSVELRGHAAVVVAEIEAHRDILDAANRTDGPASAALEWAVTRLAQAYAVPEVPART